MGFGFPMRNEVGISLFYWKSFLDYEDNQPGGEMVEDQKVVLLRLSGL